MADLGKILETYTYKKIDIDNIIKILNEIFDDDVCFYVSNNFIFQETHGYESETFLLFPYSSEYIEEYFEIFKNSISSISKEELEDVLFLINTYYDSVSTFLLQLFAYFLVATHRNFEDIPPLRGEHKFARILKTLEGYFHEILSLS